MLLQVCDSYLESSSLRDIHPIFFLFQLLLVYITQNCYCLDRNENSESNIWVMEYNQNNQERKFSHLSPQFWTLVIRFIVRATAGDPDVCEESRLVFIRKITQDWRLGNFHLRMLRGPFHEPSIKQSYRLKNSQTNNKENTKITIKMLVIIIIIIIIIHAKQIVW